MSRRWAVVLFVLIASVPVLIVFDGLNASRTEPPPRVNLPDPLIAYEAEKAEREEALLPLVAHVQLRVLEQMHEEGSYTHAQLDRMENDEGILGRVRRDLMAVDEPWAEAALRQMAEHIDRLRTRAGEIKKGAK